MKYILLIMLLPSLILAGCSGKGSMNPDTSETDSGMDPVESVLVATWQGIDLEFTAANITQVVGDTIFSAVWEQDYEAGDNRTKNNARIYRLQSGAAEAEEILALEEEQQLIFFMADEEEAVHVLYMEPSEEGNRYFLIKEDRAGNLVYRESVSLEQVKDTYGPGTSMGKEQDEALIFERINRGIAGTWGSVFFSTSDGIAYLFDNSGRPAGREDWGGLFSGLYGNIGLVNAEDEIYLYYADSDQVIMRSIDISNGTPGSERIFLKNEMSPEEAFSAGGNMAASESPSPFSRMRVYSGYRKGVIISAGDALWKYSPETSEKEVLFNWSDKYINLNRNDIWEMGVLQDGSLCVLYHNKSTDDVRRVLIQEKEKGDLTESVTIVLGYIKPVDESFGDFGFKTIFDNLIDEFNKANTGYLIELRAYERDEYINDFYMDLLQGKGPDIFDLQSLPKDVLADKGVLEDLSPYFEASEVVKESDLLPRVRDAGYAGGKLVCVMPSFTLKGCIIEKGYAKNRDWTVEEYWALEEKYPNSNLVAPDPLMLLASILHAEVNSYINWEEKRCSFDSDRFLKLLEEVKRNWDNKGDPYYEYIEDVMEYENEKIKDFHNKDVVISETVIGSLAYYLHIKEVYFDNGDGELVGYPNPEGNPWYQMRPAERILGINSASDCKEGAWKFLEYMLSLEFQSGIEFSIPVRTEAFEAWLAFPERTDAFEAWLENAIYEVHDGWEFTDADKELLRFMVENAYWEDSWNLVIMRIICEELPPFFAGDKTAKDVAGIIQGRVLIYLNE